MQLTACYSIEHDMTPPRFTRVIDSCQTTVQLRFDRNDEQCSRGIAGGEIIQEGLRNIEITQIQVSTSATGETLSYVARVQNPRQDAFYTLIVRDSLGNIREVRDTIPGFTVQVSSSLSGGALPMITQPSALPIFSLGAIPVTGISCQTLTVLNTGIAPIRFDAVGLEKNTIISLPPQEFSRISETILIPGIPQTLSVCGAPLVLGRYADTLAFKRGCLSEQFLIVLDAETLQRAATSRCGAEINLRTSAAPASFFMEQNFPNPASNQVLIRVNIAEEAMTTMRITNSFGVVVKTLLNDVLAAGEYEISADIGDIASGSYFLTVESGKNRQTRQMSVLR